MENDREEPRVGQLDRAEAAAQDEESPPQREKSRGFAPWVIGLLVVLAVAWFLYPEPGDESAPELESGVTANRPVLPELPPAPDIPVATPASAVETTSNVGAGEPTPPPPPPMLLADSDPAVREALGSLGSSSLVEQGMQQDALLQRGVAFTDGAGQGLVLNKALGIARPAGKFTTLKASGREVIDADSYRRYDAYAQAIAEMDTATMAAAFHKFRPLMEQAYSELGYRGSDFDNVLIRALDVVIATPDISGEVEVIPKGGLYIFADPELEALPPLHKQLLRMGPENLNLIRDQARALRSTLLAP